MKEGKYIDKCLEFELSACLRAYLYLYFLVYMYTMMDVIFGLDCNLLLPLYTWESLYFYNMQSIFFPIYVFLL